MNKGYLCSVLDCFSNTKPVIDRFHISQQLHTQVDGARKHIQNHIRKYGNKDEVSKIRWAILKNIEYLTVEEFDNLILAFSKYSKLEELHYLKEEYMNILYCPSVYIYTASIYNNWIQDIHNQA